MKAGYAVAIAALLGGLWSPAASAQGPVLTCAGSNMCEADANGIAYDTIYWSFDTGSTDAIFPAYCDGTSMCSFYCPTSPGRINVTVTFWRGGQAVASASSSALCTAEPL